MPQQDKTEPATHRRKEKARKEGQVARSRELPASLMLMSVVIFLFWQQQNHTGEWRALFSRVLAIASSGDLAGQNTLTLAMVTSVQMVRWTAPVALFAWMVAVISSMAQGGLVFAPKALSPDVSRLSPVTNLKRIFSLDALSGVLKSLVPLGFLTYLFVAMLVRDWDQLRQTSRMAPRVSSAWMLGRSHEILWKSCLVFVGWAGVDILLQHYHFQQQLRMSKQELRDEFKETEGNPLIRGRVRRLQRQMRRKRMLRDVSRASVVVTNPTHYAVALEYNPETTPAPVVVAKGQNLFAQQIKQQALWHGIPMVENPPLAQALYRAVEVGESIPAKLYAAVAEILAFIYRTQSLQRNAAPAGASRPSGNIGQNHGK